jgi:hypothetical protein
MTTAPIMPKGTAVWLIDNTALTFEQIAQFCGLHVLEVQALADDQSAVGMIGVDPIKLGQLTAEEIDRCSKNPNARLLLTSSAIPELRKKNKKKYVPLVKRQERPDAVAWLLKYYPDMPDSVICSLLSTTKSTVASIRERTHARINEVRPRDPVLLGFCSQVELDAAVASLKRDQKEKE